MTSMIHQTLTSRVFALALVSSVAAGCATVKPMKDVAAQPWIEVTSARVRVLTDLDPESAEQATRDLERYRRAMLQFWGPEVDPSEKLNVVLFKNKAELELFFDPRYDGMFIGDPLGTQLVLAAEAGSFGDRASAALDTQMHELAHAVTRLVLKRQRRWLAEGLATYLETTRINADDQVVMGGAPANRLANVLTDGRIPLSQLQTWAQDAALTDSELSRYYGSSWAWVHFLFNERSEQFLTYLRQLASGESDASAWTKAFGDTSFEELERALAVHLQHGRGVVVTLPLPRVSTETAHAALSPAEVHATFARLYLSSSQERSEEVRRKAATHEVDTALGIDSQNATALALRRLLTAERPLVAGAVVRQEQAPSGICPPELIGEIIEDGPLAPGTWVKDFGPGAFAPIVGAEDTVTPASLNARLGAAEVMLVTSDSQQPRVAILRKTQDGACVINSWGTMLDGKVTMGSLTKATVEAGRTALFLIGVKREPENGPAEQRWVALATDGVTAWPALGGSGRIQFIAREARLREQAGKVLLDVKVKGPGSMVFLYQPEQRRFEQLK